MLEALFTDYTLRTVALGAAVLGAVSGALGTFAVLRQQSLIGDAVSHAALPGIAIAFWLTGSKTPLVLMVGAGLAGWLAAIGVQRIVRLTRIKYDAALGLMLAVFFGFGLMLLTFLQRRPDAAQAGLDTFLFGQAAALVTADVITMSVLGTLALALLALFWKPMHMLAFDTAFGQALGWPMRRFDALLTALLVVAIVIGLQTVGVVLMSALIIAPAAGARQWTDRLGRMTLLAMAFGAVSGVVGAVLSASTEHLPTGPTIVLCASAIVGVSLLAAPRRGLVARMIRQRRQGQRLRTEAVLLDLYALARQHARPGHPHDEVVLDIMDDGAGQLFGLPGANRRTLRALDALGYAERASERAWRLTPKGRARAESLADEFVGGRE